VAGDRRGGARGSHGTIGVRRREAAAGDLSGGGCKAAAAVG
jgi:hypothetical protein